MSQIIKKWEMGAQWHTENPFLFCAHHKDAYPKGNSRQGIDASLAGRNIGADFSGKDGFSMYHGDNVPGFPVHPHRGFETVTIVLDGFVDHFDSKGAEGRYGAGDVQWLTTGAGCQHAEMFPLVNSDKDNPTELFQVWLNLPAKDKFVEPDYKMFWSEDIPEIKTLGANGKEATVRIIAGKFQEQESMAPCPNSWANDKNNHVGIFLIRMSAGATLTLPALSKTLNRNLYFYRGAGTINIDDSKVGVSTQVKLKGSEEITITNGDKESYLFLLEGEPINEPVVQYGPFVMNTEEEIYQAMDDYRKTQFGVWTWKTPDPVHERDSGRFARYPDGRIEKK